MWRMTVIIAVVFIAATATAQNRVVEIKDPVEYANILIVDKKFTQAEEFLRAILAREDAPPQQRRLMLYLLGLSLGGQERYEKAAEVFRGILDVTPAMARVRLALGRVLFLDGNDAAAKRQFDLVLSDTAGEASLHMAARRHLAAIRARNGWHFSGNFRFTQNNNINNAPDNTAVVHIGGLPFSSPSSKKSEVGVAFGFSGTHQRQLGRDKQWVSRFSYGGGAFPGALDSSTALQFAAGPGFLFDDGRFAALAVGGQNFSRGNPSSNFYGLNMSADRLLNRRWRANFSGQYVRQNSEGNDDADANVYYTQGGINGGFAGVASGGLLLYATKNNAKSARLSYFSSGGKVSLRRDFRWSSVTGGVSYTRARLRYTSASPLLGVREKNKTTALRLSLLKRDWRIFGAAPELSVVFNKQKSNVATSNFDNRIFEINITRNF